MPVAVPTVQLEPLWHACATLVTEPGASVCPAPSLKLVAEMVMFQPAPDPRASTSPSTGAYETVWSVPSRVSLIDGLAGRFSDRPAAPVIVAVVVSVAAVAAAAAASAATATARVRESRSLCLLTVETPRVGDRGTTRLPSAADVGGRGSPRYEDGRSGPAR